MQLTHGLVPPVQAYTMHWKLLECQSREELIMVTWMPSWEPEETKETWPTFKQCLLEFEAKQSKPDFSRPTADFALSNLERQGFEEPHGINAWR
eukprot:1143991-Pelagomonas_calceolata.AAC.1